MSRIALAADHGGFDYKTRIAGLLTAMGHEVRDFGTDTPKPVDYPDVARAAAEAVGAGQADFGVIVCGSGIGVSIAANKVHGVRAANCTSVEMARLAREHNHANVLTIGERLIPWEMARQIVETFFSTPGSDDERHLRRIAKIESDVEGKS